MIKAKELVWEDSCVEQSSVSYQSFFGYSYWAHKVFSHFESCIAGENIGVSKTLEEAKAACQAHYQQVVESMVDMGRLKRAIKNALINGNYFVDGPNEEDRTDFFLEEIEKEFKTLEQKKEE